jgi:3-hydroxyisobutyrate dehydrogenase-like beta-hydroxyacid dehydrogenase
MGGAMALRLRELGWAVGVRDIVPAREAECARAGATTAPTSAALAWAHPVVVVAVVDAAQCDAVLFGSDGLVHGARSGESCVVLCPTLGPASTEAIAAHLGEQGVGCIDAPMSGGPARALDGSMSLLVACADALFARHRALLEALSTKIFRVGERAGDGARTKLVNNLLAAINLAGAAEAIALAERIGLDPARTLDVIEQSSGQSWIGSDRMRRAIAGDWAPRAHTTLLDKDSRLALEMAAEAGFDAPLGAAARERFRAACAAGFGDLDDASLLRLLRES